MSSRKNYPVKSEFKTENVKTEENVNTEHGSRGEEDVHQTTKRVSFTRHEYQVKQDHYGYIDKNVI